MDTMGETEPLPERLSDAKEKVFQEMVSRGYSVTSHECEHYNCIAHAADDKTQKWDPIAIPPVYYWPKGADRGDGADSLATAFMAIGYERCAGGEPEDGFEKVALYIDDNGSWQHAAKQLPNGQWSSKLGEWEDVMHQSPHCFGDTEYGKVAYYMRRRIKEGIGEAQPKAQSAETEEVGGGRSETSQQANVPPNDV